MDNTYRVVLLDADGHEVGDVQTLRMCPTDVLIIMPQHDCVFSEAGSESINRTFQELRIAAVVFRYPVQLARLERVE